MLHGFASPVQKTDSFLQPAIFDPINIRLPAFKQIAENSGLVYVSRRILYSIGKDMKDDGGQARQPGQKWNVSYDIVVRVGR